MDYIMKNRIWFWIMIALIIINIVALTTLIYHKNRMSSVPPVPPAVENPEFRGMNYFLRHELNLSEVQFKEFVKLRRANMRKTASLMIEINEKRNQMLDEISNDEPVDRKINKLAEEIGELHEELKLETFRHFLDLKEICTPEQQVKLNRFFMEVKERTPRPRYNRPGRHRGQGWRHNREFQ